MRNIRIPQVFTLILYCRKWGNKKREAFASLGSCGGLTRTDDLWVMSPTSYQLLHSAMLFFVVAEA